MDQAQNQNGHPAHPTTGKWNEIEEVDPRRKGNQQKWWKSHIHNPLMQTSSEVEDHLLHERDLATEEKHDESH